ncbi:Cation efflux system protein CusF precursor [compost metagenome]
MKSTLIAVTGAIAVLSLAAQAEDMPGMKMDDMSMKDMPMARNVAPAPSAQASGLVKAIDTQKGTVTIAHGPVASLKWPAMTMAFKATPEQLTHVKAGDQVKFEFQSEGMAASLTSIEAMK